MNKKTTKTSSESINNVFGNWVTAAATAKSQAILYRELSEKLTELVKDLDDEARLKLWDTELKSIAEKHYKAMPNATDKVGAKGKEVARWKQNCNVRKGRFMQLGKAHKQGKRATFAFAKYAEAGAKNQQYASLLTMFRTSCEKHGVKNGQAMNVACAIAAYFNQH